MKKRFNPRVPCGTRQKLRGEEKADIKFQSTRPVRDATNGKG